MAVNFNPNVKEIVESYLHDNGFDGLYREKCGCVWPNLIPCSGTFEDCCFGYADEEDFVGPTKEDE